MLVVKIPAQCFSGPRHLPSLDSWLQETIAARCTFIYRLKPPLTFRADTPEGVCYSLYMEGESPYTLLAWRTTGDARNVCGKYNGMIVRLSVCMADCGG